MNEQPPQSAFFEESARINPQNIVTIRIWMPHYNGSETTAFNALKKIKKGNENANVGHVSIETPNIYSSIWPDPSQSVTNAFKVYTSKLHSLEEDINAEGRPCDLIVCLYSLKPKDIENAFEQVKQLGIGYVLSGDLSLAEKGGQSCCSLASSLLCKGNIAHLGTNDSSISKIVTTPDDLARYVKEIKAEELRRFPKTRDFPLLDNEYIPPQISRTATCTLL